MKYILQYSLLIFATLYFVYQGFSQDAILLLRDENPLYFNPALTGSRDYTRAAVNYRNHLPSVGNGFVTYSASFDTYLNNYNSGIGVSIMCDQPGSKAYSYNNAMLAYSYRINTSKTTTLQAALLASFYYSVRNTSGLVFPDMINSNGGIYDNIEAYQNSRAIGIDIATGGVFTSKWYKMGVAVYHLGNKNDSSYHHRELRLNAHLEVRIPLYAKNTYATPQSTLHSILKETQIKPYIYYWQQGISKLVGIGADLQTKNFRLGIASRQDVKFESMIFSTRIGFAASFMEIDYVFDIGRMGSNLRGLSSTSHEIGVIFKFGEEKEY